MREVEVSELAARMVREAVNRGFDEAAARVVELRSVMVKLANSEVSVVQRWSNLSISLYLAKEGRILTTTLSSSNIDRVGELVERCLSAASQLKPSPLYAPLPEPAPVEPLSGLVDKAVVENMADPAPLAEDLVGEALEAGAEKVAGTLTLSCFRKGLATSRGVELSESSTGVEGYLRAFIGESSGQWAVGGRRLDKTALRLVARTAADLALRARGEPRRLEPGTYDLVLSPMVVGNLMDLVGMMSSALAVMMGFSIFARVKPGSKVASERFTLLDEPRNPELLGSTAFDDEGMPTRNKPIIEEGVLKTLLHNTKTASKMGAASTGNAGWVRPHPWTLRIPAGDASLDEMISEVRRGLLITNNWYTRLQNYVEGIFSTIARDATIYIEYGELKHPVARVRIADKLPTLLSNIELIGRELYDISWWEVKPPVRAPYILVRSIHVSRPFD
ncbi:MAG: TldD/PmbA family protein [Thermoprotei archaeon]|nr:MAG: TldD/PmbA family protein [Thermoprotei archaeon]